MLPPGPGMAIASAESSGVRMVASTSATLTDVISWVSTGTPEPTSALEDVDMNAVC